MSAPIELLPCPFCGSKKAEIIDGSYEIDDRTAHTRNVVCVECNAMGPDTEVNDAVAAEKWNFQLPARDRLRAELVKLEDLARNRTVTRQTLRDRIQAILAEDKAS